MSASEASGSVCMSSTQSAVLPMGVVKTTHSPAERAKSVCSSPCVRFYPEAKITQYSPGARVMSGKRQRTGSSESSERYQPSSETLSVPAL